LASGDHNRGIAKVGTDVNDTVGTRNLTVELVMTHNSTNMDMVPFAADIFTFGSATNNAIYRILLEESGDNTATFEGSVEYIMLNQINVNAPATYTGMSAIDQDIDIIVNEDMTDEDSPRINYYDIGLTVFKLKLQTK